MMLKEVMLILRTSLQGTLRLRILIHRAQVCLSPVPADVDIEGMALERISDNIDKYRCLGGSCREGVISHFRMKRRYYVYTRPPPSQASFLLISQYGFVPCVSLPRTL